MTDTSSSNSESRIPVARRTVLVAGGATAAALAVGGAASAGALDGGISQDNTAPAAAAVCTLTREMTEGPYYLDGQYVRADISEGKPGVPLKLTLTVVDDDTCAPLRGALVELWHADALGEYSGFVGANGHSEPDNGTFLRGGVLTNSSGVATITSIYPGWYIGRCIHIHVKVHTGVTVTSDGHYTGGREIHTGQLFFNETVTTRVATVSPYSTNRVTRTTLSRDSIYDGGGAASGLLTLSALGSTPSAGYAGTLTLGVETS
ncbi:intradiol ring-cleavage dioxygenase [Streptomyces sp. NPDC006172]|uniref:intradiol ring-cleavage dioxygenase n=1 Tax=Streptomyces sp. NPDC006172 TaxID=3154470 RepID=UPI0033DF54D8